jgi:type I restriction enzyme S subunit
MQKIFSREIRFKDEDGNEFPEWEEKKLGEVGEIITGKTPSTNDNSLWGGDIQFVTPTDISKDKFQYKASRYVVNHNKMKILPKNTIMFTCIASIGKMSLSIFPCITNQQINSIIPNDNFENEFVFYALLQISDFIKSTRSNTTLPIINKSDFSNFIICAPSLPEQQKILSFLSSIDEKIDKNEDQIRKTELWKKGLLQQMFI